MSPFFQTFSKSDLNLLFLIKHHMEEIREGFIKKNNKILIGKTCVKRNYIYYFYQFFCFFVCFDLLKKERSSNFNEISLKKEGNYFETLFSPSFDVLYSSPMFYMNHTDFIFQGLLLYCTKKVPENRNHFFHFRHGGETHFLVLAQTLI